MNIWSHLLGTELFLLLLIEFCYRNTPSLELVAIGDVTAIAVFYASVVICFALSTSFHVCLNHSPEAHKLGNELDHLGIIAVMWGSTVPSDYFGFYCDAALQRFYWTLVLRLSSTTIRSLTQWTGYFDGPRLRHLHTSTAVPEAKLSVDPVRHVFAARLVCFHSGRTWREPEWLGGTESAHGALVFSWPGPAELFRRCDLRGAHSRAVVPSAIRHLRG